MLTIEEIRALSKVNPEFEPVGLNFLLPFVLLNTKKMYQVLVHLNSRNQ